MDWLRWRAEFPILERTTYLNSCSLGALSRRAERRLHDFLLEWHQRGAAAWYDTWLARLDELRLRFARTIGADPADIALTASVSAALTSIASAIDHRDRPRVVCSSLDFPTLGYQWQARPDVHVVHVNTDDHATIDLQRWDDAVDQRTAVLATSHVFFTTGAIQDLRALAEIAHRAGALLVIDGYQSAGQIPVDVRALDVDVFIAGPLKWLLGGPGLAYAYVRPELVAELRPRVAGWFGSADPFSFEIERFDFRGDARRYELGTPSLHTVHTALGGQEIIDEIGVGRIRERNRALTERLVARAEAAGLRLRIAPDSASRSAIVMVAVEDPHGAVAHLAGAGITVDARPGHVRVSPHFYNVEDELDSVVEELSRWRR